MKRRCCAASVGVLSSGRITSSSRWRGGKQFIRPKPILGPVGRVNLRS